MNFSQLHEQLRVEVLRRIERKVITASALAQLSGLRQPHISNFLRNRRRLSYSALDRVLDALGLSAADLLLAPATPILPTPGGVPMVAQQSAMNDDVIRAPSIQAIIPFAILDALPLPRAERNTPRHPRQRFVAVSLTAQQSAPMAPYLSAPAIVILDRHANTPSSAASIYAVRLAAGLHFCYVSYDRGALLLSHHVPETPSILLPVPPSAAPSELVVGRVCCILRLA